MIACYRSPDVSNLLTTQLEKVKISDSYREESYLEQKISAQ